MWIAFRPMKISMAVSTLAVFLSLPSFAEETRQVTAAPEVSEEAFFAAMTASGGQKVKLPPLAYWGVQGVAWGTSRSDVMRASPAFAPGARAPVSNQAGQQECSVSGLPCNGSIEFSAGGLSMVQYRFAADVSDRRVRLGMYKSLLNSLRGTYGEPSRQPDPIEDVNGQDAYVQGLNDRYEAQWSGPESNVTLLLSDGDLAIKLMPAVQGNATMRERELSDFRQQVQKLPASSSLKNILAK